MAQPFIVIDEISAGGRLVFWLSNVATLRGRRRSGSCISINDAATLERGVHVVRQGLCIAIALIEAPQLRHVHLIQGKIPHGALARPGAPHEEIAKAKGVTNAQLAIAWLLKRSPVMLPIPGTSRLAHLEENVAAASIELTDEEFEAVDRIARPG